MTKSLDKYLTLERRIESLLRERDKDQGALDLMIKRLREEFKCKDLKAAKAKKKKKARIRAKLEREFTAELKRLEKELNNG